MNVEKLFGSRAREAPADAQSPGHKILLRGGYVHQVSQGIFALLPLGQRACQKVTRIVREEMDAIDGQELLMPVVCPAELWRKSGRYDSVGPELVRFEDRMARQYVLSMTHEEPTVELASAHVMTYRQLPFMVYQFQTKFRDEPRSRAGLIRVREFVMKDAYSFHRTAEDLDAYYERCRAAYQRAFARCGLVRCVDVQSDTGMMGGAGAHEFMLLTPVGEDTLLLCDQCGYRANREVACCRREYPERAAPAELRRVATPGAKSIEEVSAALGVTPSGCAKALLLVADGTRRLVGFVRGDLEINLTKLRKVARFRDVRPMREEEAAAAGLVAGYVGLAGLGADVEIYVDQSVTSTGNLVVGANEPGFHATGFDYERDSATTKVLAVADIAEVVAGDPCIQCGSALRTERGVEVGNIFKLGVKYTESMGMSYTEEDGTRRFPIMGCYGLGIGRTLACVVEEHNDEHGPLWPISVAPFEVEVIALGANDENVLRTANVLHEALLSAGVETLIDTRTGSAGVLFADADLIGAPVRVVVSRRNMKDDSVEISYRTPRRPDGLPTRARTGEASGVVRDAVVALRAQFAAAPRVPAR